MLTTVTGVKDKKITVYRDRKRHKPKLQYAYTGGFEEVPNPNWKEFGENISEEKMTQLCCETQCSPRSETLEPQR